jgi:hypothetical protein
MILLITKTLIKAALIAFLFACIGRHPYFYYQLLRWSVFMGMIATIIIDYRLKNYFWIIPAIVIGVLFNPLSSFRFPRYTWQKIDRDTAIVLLIWIAVELMWGLYKTRKRNEEK